MSSKILYSAFDVVPSPKGASTHITRFTQGLTTAGRHVTLVSAGHAGLPQNEPYAGADLWRAPAVPGANFLQRALDFGEFVMDRVETLGPFDVVHFRGIWSGFPLSMARTRFQYRLLFEVNGLPSVEMAYHYPGLFDTPTQYKIKERELATLHAADWVICPSRVTRDYLLSLGLPHERISVIPNGVDPEMFRPPEAAAGPQTPTILYQGTLADWQGLECLIAAMPYVLIECPVRLVILGRGRKHRRKTLTRLIRKLELEEWVSIQDPVPHEQVPQHIARADVCVAPLGYNERNVTQGCCPIKILEYMACGRPIAASNLPVVRELLQPDVDGLVFPPDDPQAMAECLLRLLQDRDLAARLGANAAERVRRHFTWRRAQQRLLELIDALESGPVAGPNSCVKRISWYNNAQSLG